MTTKASLERVAFSPGEFAKLFGKSQTWGYRQIYGGKIKAITEHGRILIPAAEVEAILKTAGVYNGIKPKVAKSKAEIQSLSTRLPGAWQSFLVARRKASESTPPSQTRREKTKWPTSSSARLDAMARLTTQSGKAAN